MAQQDRMHTKDTWEAVNRLARVADGALQFKQVHGFGYSGGNLVQPIEAATDRLVEAARAEGYQEGFVAAGKQIVLRAAKSRG